MVIPHLLQDVIRHLLQDVIPHIPQNVIPLLSQRHPAFNAGSVLYERINRDAFNAVFEERAFV